MRFNREDVISELDTQIRWIEEIDGHKFPGWCGATMAMRYAMMLLKDDDNDIHHMSLIIDENERQQKEQEEQKRKMLQHIADVQLANAPIETMDATSHTYYDGVWHGLEMAYEILTEKEENE